MLEIVLRNAVHATLMAHTGKEWWFKEVLHVDMHENLLKEFVKITKEDGQPPTVGKLISRITFGFWPKLFGKSYNDLWWTPGAPLLPSVLPHYAKIGRHTRGELEERLEYFLALRNRIMHHEAIFEGVKAINRPMLPIDDVHNQLIETIGWISADAEKFVITIDRFNAVYEPQG